MTDSFTKLVEGIAKDADAITDAVSYADRVVGRWAKLCGIQYREAEFFLEQGGTTVLCIRRGGYEREWGLFISKQGKRPYSVLEASLKEKQQVLRVLPELLTAWKPLVLEKARKLRHAQHSAVRAKQALDVMERELEDVEDEEG